MQTQTPISPRVLRILELIKRLEPRERSQLGELLPPEVTSLADVPEETVAQAISYFQEKARQRATPPSLDDVFVGGLTFREYFALPEEEATALWEELAAEAPELEDLPVIEARPDARVPS